MAIFTDSGTTHSEAHLAASPREVMYRHSVTVRLTHWINVLIFAALLASGLRIFESHPALYWGNDGYDGVPSFLSVDIVLGVRRRQAWGRDRHHGAALRHAAVSGLAGAAGRVVVRARHHFDAAWLLVLAGLVYGFDLRRRVGPKTLRHCRA
jgi:hypothetical protein